MDDNGYEVLNSNIAQESQEQNGGRVFMKTESARDLTFRIGEPPCVVRKSIISEGFIMIDRLKQEKQHYLWQELAQDEAIKRNRKYIKSR